MDFLHRVVIGSPDSRREWRIAFIVVAVWIGIDVIQFTDWASNKVWPQPVACKVEK
jgi:hypothetical protein